MATIKDIAKKANVSLMTVSRVINTPEKVKEETRNKVLKVIKELDYSQNLLAKSLVLGKTRIIYIYIPSAYEITTPFVSQTVAAIGERLGERGYSFFFGRKPYKDEQCDGIIYMGLEIGEEKSFINVSKVKPSILFGNSDEFSNWIDVDNHYGEFLMTEEMIKRGHRRIAYLGLEYNARYAKQRFQGYCDCLNKYDIEYNDNYVIFGENTEDAGYNMVKKIIENNAVFPDAIICASDLLGIGAVHYLSKRGLQIPKEIAIGGFDGFGYEKMIYPELSTIKQPLFNVGRKIADEIIDRVEAESFEQNGIYIMPIFSLGSTM